MKPPKKGGLLAIEIGDEDKEEPEEEKDYEPDEDELEMAQAVLDAVKAGDAAALCLAMKAFGAAGSGEE